MGSVNEHRAEQGNGTANQSDDAETTTALTLGPFTTNDTPLPSSAGRMTPALTAPPPLGAGAMVVEITATATGADLGAGALAPRAGERIADAIAIVLRAWCTWYSTPAVQREFLPGHSWAIMRDDWLPSPNDRNPSERPPSDDRNPFELPLPEQYRRLLASGLLTFVTAPSAGAIADFLPAGGLTGTCNGEQMTVPTPLPAPPQERERTGGRPRGSKTVHVSKTLAGVLEMPSDGALAFGLQAIGAPLAAWKPELLGRPEYRSERGHINGSVIYLRPGEERMSTPAVPQAIWEAACAELWEGVATLGPADMQLLMYLSNEWMALPQATDGIRLTATAYAGARGLKREWAAARGQRNRDGFNAAVHNLASLDLHATVAVRVKGKHRETQVIRGRLVLAEAIGGVYTGPLEGFDGPRRADVTAWRLVPGIAWLASRDLRQIGRYPAALLALDPYRKALHIKLGAYLGYQTAVRASSGTLAQPLSVGAILHGIHELIPEDHRALHKLRERFEKALDELAAQGILTSWQWERKPGRGRDGFTYATIAFVYHDASVRAHAEHHKAARRALGSHAVQRLLPEGHSETSLSGDGN